MVLRLSFFILMALCFVNKGLMAAGLGAGQRKKDALLNQEKDAFFILSG